MDTLHCKRGRIIETIFDFLLYIVEEIRNEGKDEDEFIYVQMEVNRDNINAAIGGHIKVLGG